MKRFQGKTAVITGAASGIGFALSRSCASRGMNVVMADISRERLREAAALLEDTGADVLAIPTDSSKAEDVEALAQAALEKFGSVQLLFNNAGVAAGKSLWEDTQKDLEWALGVNLWGAINGVRSFVPQMLKQGDECHIVNTSSLAGLLTFHPSASYQISKHAVVALSKQLYHDLKTRGAKIGVSVLCPGFVDTNILDSERNRPQELKNSETAPAIPPDQQAMLELFKKMLEMGLQPDEVAEMVIKAVDKDQFYILTHPEMLPVIETRMRDIISGANPTPPEPPSLPE